LEKGSVVDESIPGEEELPLLAFAFALGGRVFAFSKAEESRLQRVGKGVPVFLWEVYPIGTIV
jgi:hypothetical protein